MSIGSDRSYANPTKHAWRGWAWNQLARRLACRGVRLQQATVIYFAGPENNDAEHAISKGFDPKNLLPIDISERNVSRVRRSGMTAVAEEIGNLLPVIDRPVDGVIFDYCGGITGSTIIDMVRAFGSRCLMPHSVAIWNFMRGRDSGVGEACTRSRFQAESIASQWVWDKRRKRFVDTCVMKPVGKHRGFEFLYLQMLYVFAVSAAAHAGIDFSEGDGERDMWDATRAILHTPEGRQFWQIMWDTMKPSFASYPSGHLWFDSVAIYWGHSQVADCSGAVPDATRRKWIACKAVATRRATE